MTWLELFQKKSVVVTSWIDQQASDICTFRDFLETL